MANKNKKRKKFSKSTDIVKFVIRSFLIAIFVILLILFIFLFIHFVDSLYNVEKGESTNPLFGAYVIVTESMVPTINVNDAIIVKRVDDKEINIGDIITFSSVDKYYFGKTITHRVIEIKNTGSGNYIYKTKGDNNSLADDALVNFNNIYGKVILRIPKVGYVQKFVTSPFGFVSSIVLPILLVIIYEVWRVRKTIKLRNDEIEIL